MQKSNCVFSLSSDENGTLLSVELIGDIDHHGAVGVRSEIDGAISEHRPTRTVLVLSGVEFMDSSGIGLLIGRYKSLLRIGADAEIINANKEVKRILDMAGIFKIMLIKEEIA